MTDIKPDHYSDVVCHCSGTTQRKIKELIDSGSNDLDVISRKTGACSGCGACEHLILQLIADHCA